MVEEKVCVVAMRERIARGIWKGPDRLKMASRIDQAMGGNREGRAREEERDGDKRRPRELREGRAGAGRTKGMRAKGRTKRFRVESSEKGWEESGLCNRHP